MVLQVTTAHSQRNESVKKKSSKLFLSTSISSNLIINGTVM